MVEHQHWLNEPISWKGGFIEACNQALGRNAVVAYGSDGLVSGNDLTPAEIAIIKDINKRFSTLDSWEPSKLRNLTIQQINDRIATVQGQIDAVTNVATAKTALNSMYADMQKMARIIIWLLKREMNEL